MQDAVVDNASSFFFFFLFFFFFFKIFQVVATFQGATRLAQCFQIKRPTPTLKPACAVCMGHLATCRLPPTRLTKAPPSFLPTPECASCIRHLPSFLPTP
eukprot:366071-Chlamydomonas_euryale.AAC.10